MVTTGLVLRSDLSELRRLVEWLDELETSHGIPPRTRFAMDLCLEEAVSNTIRHGYAGRTDGTVAIGFRVAGDGLLELTIEDGAPPFNPLMAEPHVSRDTGAPDAGGRGIMLMRGFANRLTYDRLAHGNRLTLGFVPDQT